MCNHEHTYEQIINTSHEVWHNGVGTWVEEEAPVLVCSMCGAIYDPENGRWDK